MGGFFRNEPHSITEIIEEIRLEASKTNINLQKLKNLMWQLENLPWDY